MNKEKIRVGIIGVSPNRGWAKFAHIPALRALEGYEIKAVSSSEIANAKAVAEEIGAPFYFSNNDDLVSCSEVDLVVIAVKVPFHRKLVMSALKAGKSVYCEWPLGNGLDEAIEMEKLATEKGAYAHVGLQSRAAPVIRYLHDLISRGHIGEVLSTSLNISIPGAGLIDQGNAYTLDKSNGATLLSIAVGHTLDAVCFCLGELTGISSTTAVRRKTATIIETQEQISVTAADQIVVIGTLPNGAPLSLHFSGADTIQSLFWEIHGTKGKFRLTAESAYTAAPGLILQVSEKSELVTMDIPSEYSLVTEIDPSDIAFNVAQNYALLEQDIRLGTSHSPTFADAVLRHRMLKAIEVADETGEKQQYIV